MQLYRFTWTVADHGFAVENGERFLDAFTHAYPELGASVAQNTATGHLSVTFSINASDIHDAVERAREVFATGAAASGLEPSEVVDLAASLATAEQYEPERELQPA